MRYNLIILYLLAHLFLPSGSWASTIQGIVLGENGPLTDAIVKAYESFEDLANDKNAVSSIQGEKPGQYILEIPAGRYYFTASAKNNGSKSFSYHGLNPISISAKTLWLPFFSVRETNVTCEDGYQGIGGSILYKGQPVQSGSVSVYSIEDEPYRGMGVLTNTVEESGSYWFDLEPGEYVVIARQRQDLSAIGPLKKGDLFCYNSANPITIKPAQSCTVDLSCYPRDDIETFLNQKAEDPRGKREEKRRNTSLETASLQETSTTSGNSQFSIVAGRVTDADDIPIPDLFVSAYPAGDLFLFQMYIVRFKSNYIAKTDKNGMFRMEMPAGPYYLVARERVGEAPISGEYYGLYEGTPNHTIEVKAGSAINGLQIITGPIMP